MITEMMKPNIVNSWLLLTRFAVVMMFLTMAATAWSDDSQIWESLKTDGHIALLRHALAPGIGDPSAFQLDDCSSQRNLSDEGRAQAKQIGDRFRENGIAAAEVYSSQWCRCLDTAALLGLGTVKPLEAINSFFQDFERREGQTASLEKWIRSRTLKEPIVLITHQVNITALTGNFAASGELIVVRVPEGAPLEVVGTLQIN